MLSNVLVENFHFIKLQKALETSEGETVRSFHTADGDQKDFAKLNK